MRVSSFLVLLWVSGCAANTPNAVDDDPTETPDPVFDHVCDAFKYEAAQDDQAWTVAELDACFDGCDQGGTAGYDQGRLVCLTEGDFCPDCVADQEGETYDAGYKACFASRYAEGYADEGCTEA